MKELLDKLDFWSKLTPTNKVLVTLLCVILFIGWHGYEYQGKLEAERDDFKNRNEKLFTQYQEALTANQKAQNDLKDGCQTMFQEYQDKKEAEIKDITREFQVKYLDLLGKYQTVLENQNNKTQIK